MFGGDSTLSIIIKAKDEASAVIKQVGGAVEGTGASMGGLLVTAGKVTAGVTAAAAAIAAISFPAIKAASDLEQTKIAFTTMLGSAEKADAFVRDLVQFAKTTPFELTGLNQASKQLLAYGFAQEEVIPNLKSLGDIAAGVGMDKLPNLILAFGQVKAATKLTGMELRQFTEAGVPLLDALSQELGKPVSAIQEMVSAGEIDFPLVQQALENLTGEGGRFNNLMAKQAQSLGGIWSNLQDAWNIFLANEGAKLLDFVKQLVLGLTYLVQSVLPPLIDSIMGTIGGFRGLVTSIEDNTGLITLLRQSWELISTTFMTQLWPALKQLWVSLQPLMPLLQAMAAIFGVTLVGAIEAVVIILAGLITGLTKLITFGVQVANAITKFIVEPFQAVVNVLAQVINSLDQVASKLNVVGALKSAGGSLFNSVSSAVSSAGKYFSFEQGGIVPGAVGTPVPIIAHGQERVIPAGQSSSSGSSIVINFNNTSVRSDSDVQALRNEFDDYFRQIMINRKLAI